MQPDMTVAMDVTRHEESGTFLILRKATHYTKQRYEENPWELPGGKIEDDEEPRKAAVRELREETGLSGSVAERGEPYTFDIGGTTIMFIPFLVRVRGRDVSLSEEHEEYEWLERTEIDTRVTEHEHTALERLQL